MKLEIREEPAKMIYIDDQLVAMFKMNGKLKLYKIEEVGYANIEEIFSETRGFSFTGTVKPKNQSSDVVMKNA